MDREFPPANEGALPEAVFRVSAPKARILLGLRGGAMTAAQVGRALGVDKAAAYRHLVALHTAGLVRREREGGKYVFYQLTSDGLDVARLLDAD
jgi:predicted ArsR family transcriptional regulator